MYVCVDVGSFTYPLKNLVSILEIPRDPLHVTKLFIVWKPCGIATCVKYDNFWKEIFTNLYTCP